MILYLRYQADIWVEVDTEVDDVLQVVVDEATMARARVVLVGSGEPAGRIDRAAAERIADDTEWPSWDYGQRPALTSTKR